MNINQKRNLIQKRIDDCKNRIISYRSDPQNLKFIKSIQAMSACMVEVRAIQELPADPRDVLDINMIGDDKNTIEIITREIK